MGKVEAHSSISNIRTIAYGGCATARASIKVLGIFLIFAFNFSPTNV
ncbi:MAG TPA: hypothetical protein VK203_25605 [Nostocaceae cyanobacterium]|nr:hypothetical protein [Nostocaceae cyanobacterium]